MPIREVCKPALALLLAATLAAPVMADPPSHAPAHGYRNKDKQARRFKGYTGVEWQEDYGVREGRCNTDTVLTVVGAAGGAIIGNRTASAENRTIATIIGAVAGGIIGNQIGEAIDDGDRGCIGHSLEMGAVGQRISWTNPRTHVAYTLRPVADLQDGCRRFEYRPGASSQLQTMTACRREGAAWVIRPR
jgi:outer membrane lipoprotein SlyB